MVSVHLISTVAPTASIFRLISSASPLETFSLIAFGVPSTMAFTSFKSRLVISFTSLMTCILVVPARTRITSNFSSHWGVGCTTGIEDCSSKSDCSVSSLSDVAKIAAPALSFTILFVSSEISPFNWSSCIFSGLSSFSASNFSEATAFVNCSISPDSSFICS